MGLHINGQLSVNLYSANHSTTPITGAPSMREEMKLLSSLMRCMGETWFHGEGPIKAVHHSKSKRIVHNRYSITSDVSASQDFPSISNLIPMLNITAW